jgi:probable pyrazinamidase/nicotinamidase
MNVLIVVDPQKDFISGSLAVPEADKAMSYLSQWMLTHANDFDTVFVSMDQHPINHCSFKSEGGIWAHHCVRYSEGAAIDEGIMSSLIALQKQGKNIHFIEKATEVNQEEYSAFARLIPTELVSADKIFLAGLAGDYCVHASQEDLLRCIPKERIERIEEGIAWIQKP